MVEGLRDALQYITGLKEKSMEPKIVEIEGSTYCTRDLVRYHRFPMASSLSVNTLTALVDYIKGETRRIKRNIYSPCSKPNQSELVFGVNR